MDKEDKIYQKETLVYIEELETCIKNETSAIARIKEDVACGKKSIVLKARQIEMMKQRVAIAKARYKKMK